MGVPAFFRYLQEKYPKIVTRALEQKAKPGGFVDASKPNPNGYEFDNLYLDMNGLIHPCTHPEGEPAPTTEEEMYLVIFRYLDRLFDLVRPRKLIYMAIDGVAPRAKMNQQRSRRFRSAQEAAEAAEDAERIRKEMKERGIKPPKKADPAWDSNVITPGTEFMNKLSEWLRYYIAERLNKNAAYRNVRIILSDAQSPGEGEHKLMQFIRRQRAEPGYDPNTTHCMYGLDADLIMLGLASHEIHFTILREEVLFGKQKKMKEKAREGYKIDPVLLGNGDIEVSEEAMMEMGMVQVEKKPFDLVRLWVLREYLAYEFREETFYQPLTFEYSFEACIDDFVFICFFVGNDFLPHLPSLSIHEGGLDLLLDIYRRVLPTVRGYLTTDGKVNLERVDVFMAMLGEVEDEIFERRRRRELRDKERKAHQALTRKAGGKQRALAQSQMQHHRQDIQPVPRGKKATKVDLPPPPPVGLIRLGGHRNKTTAEIKAATAPDVEANKAVAAELRKKLKRSAPAVEQTPAIAPLLKRTRLTTSSVKKNDDDDDDDDGKDSNEDKKEQESSSDGEDDEEALEEFGKLVKELEKERNIDENVLDEVRLGESGWKERYYVSKFGPSFKDPKSQDRRKLVKEYVTGLCWVMQYYYKGVQSWTWFYPYHYAPMASDLVNIDEFEIDFPPSKPFKPVEQLMGVFPSSSAHALPKPCRWYMRDENSPIADFYPKQFDYDPNGKAVRWLWIALLPFIDEKRLTDVTKSIEDELDPKDKARNELHPDLVFAHIETRGTSEMLAAVEEDKQNASEETKEDDTEDMTPTTAGDVRGISGRLLSPKETNGIAGYFRKPPAKFTLALNEEAPAPARRVDPIPNNKVAVFEFRLPKMRKHFCNLLEGVTMPAVTLSIQDLMNVKAPVMGPQNSSVANLLIQQRGGHPSSRGGQPHSGINPHQYNQQLAHNVHHAGLLQNQNRGQYTWGSMEPRPRNKYNNHHHNNHHNGFNQQSNGYPRGYQQPRYNHPRGYEQQQHQQQQQRNQVSHNHNNRESAQRYDHQHRSHGYHPQQHMQHNQQYHHQQRGNYSYQPPQHQYNQASRPPNMYQHLARPTAPRGYSHQQQPPVGPPRAFVSVPGPRGAPDRSSLMNSLASTLRQRNSNPKQ